MGFHSASNRAAATGNGAKRPRIYPAPWLPGELHLIRRTGKNGDFMTGKLITGMGEFAVRDKVLEQYEPGVFKGQFCVGYTCAKSFNWKGKIIIDVQAYLDDFTIQGEEPISKADTAAVMAAIPDIPNEPDTVATKSVATAQAAAQVAVAAGELSLVELIKMGFVADLDLQPEVVLHDGVIARSQLAAIAQRSEVALDVRGCERELLSLQRDYLKSLGYRFRKDTQTWLIPAIPTSSALETAVGGAHV